VDALLRPAQADPKNKKNKKIQKVDALLRPAQADPKLERPAQADPKNKKNKKIQKVDALLRPAQAEPKLDVQIFSKVLRRASHTLVNIPTPTECVLSV
jgi:hypothetical protein